MCSAAGILVAEESKGRTFDTVSQRDTAISTKTANFTKRWIESLKYAPTGKRITYRDEKSPHLELVVGTSSKVFYW
jgi:hypothetical protein